MLESFKGKKFSYTALSKEDMEKRGILGRLVGPIADTKAPTRNGRTYSKELWEHVFDDPIMQEKIKNRCLFQELGHPEDRTEVDIEKICSCLAETPKLGDDGLLYGVFDILPTKNGQLLKILCDYGTTIGISSRGTGDVIDIGNGEEVDPETYDCETWDFVVIPAVEKARLTYVTESLDTHNNDSKLRKALKEELEKANPEDKKVMEETLQTLNIDLGESKQALQEEKLVGQKDDSTSHDENDGNENIDEESKESKEVLEESKEAKDDGSEELIKSLQESLMKSMELEQRVKSLQEQLAVSNAEVSKLKGENGKQKSAIVNLTKQVQESKEIKKGNSILEDRLKEKEANMKSLEERLHELEASTKSAKALNESLSSKSEEEIGSLRESLSNKDKQLAQVNEELLKEKKSSAKRLEELNEKVSKSQRMLEGYKRLANNASDKYIALKATMLGVDPQVIKSNLKESYTLEDIDEVCIKLQGEEINISRLPFKVGRNSVVQVNESKQLANPFKKQDIYDDDYVDEGLMRVAGIIK